METRSDTPVREGDTLGAYRIETRLGMGGMGEVFRAVDTRLNRKVAIKFSNVRFSERFEREALALSALNHPHICTLYDVGSDYTRWNVGTGRHLRCGRERLARPCRGAWSPDGRFLYVDTQSVSDLGRKLAFPIASGESMPELPAGVSADQEKAAEIPGVKLIRRTSIAPSLSPETFVFVRSDFVGNLFQIPLH